MQDGSNTGNAVPWYKNLRGYQMICISIIFVSVFLATNLEIFDWAFFVFLIFGIIEMFRERKDASKPKQSSGALVAWWMITLTIFVFALAIYDQKNNASSSSVVGTVAMPLPTNDVVIGNQAPAKNPVKEPSSQPQIDQQRPFLFTSSEDGFQATFPSQPSREEETTDTGAVGMAKTATYSTEKGGVSYLLFVYTYLDERMNESNPDFNVVGALEGAINAMANSDGGKLLSSKKVTMDGRDAFVYQIQINSEVMQGLIVYKGNRMYNIAVGYQAKDGAPRDVTGYLDSLTLLD